MRAVRNRCLNELQSQSHREELHLSSFCHRKVWIF